MAPQDLGTVTAAERYQRLCAAFDELQPLPIAARTPVLERLRSIDPGLVAELVQMLDASDRPGLGIRDHEIADTLPAGLGDERGYRVLAEIGRGGMGRVLLAERADGRFTRQVAIKVLDRYPDDIDWRRRFTAEREILARLVHPNIVRLLDAGETGAGIPYLVMEYVDGLTLDRYLQTHAMTLEARLTLFERIGGAVGHAHHMLVAHRDLKPANVLVDGAGQPHLLDFGIARLLSEEAATATGARALTPRYAAPEQVSGAPSTAALDTYQLGLLLYELLAGEPPFARYEGAALLRAVLEEEPPPPSRVARQRGRSDARRIDTDLDAICLRALRKEPEQRYASVDALLADLERWHAGEPVRATAGGWWYRGRKFGRRHWRSLSVAVLVLGLSAIFVWRLNQELARSEEERAVAEQATELIVNVIGHADPSKAQGQELTLSEALDQSVERMRQTPDLPPLVRARVLEAVGAAYLGLSKQNQAIPLLAEAADAFQRADDPDSQLRAMFGRAIAMQDLANYPQAQAAVEEVLAKRTQSGLKGDSFEAELHSSLANLHQYQRRPAQALAEFDQALAILRAMPEPDEAQLAHTLRNLGDIRTSQGDIEGGRKALLEALPLNRKLYGDDHPDSIRLQRMLGRNAMRRGAFEEAIAHFEQGWAAAQRVYAPPHAVRVLLAHPLALARLHRGDIDGSLALMSGAIVEAEGVFPPGHPSRATVAADLALIQFSAGRDEEARGRAREARDARVALTDTDGSIAQPELIIALLDCRTEKTPALVAQVAATLERVRSDAVLSPAALAEYERAAGECR